MENEKNQDLPEDLFADLLPSAQAEEEIATDEQAVGSHPMADISDMEFEKIMQEALSEEWDLEDIAAEELIPDAQTEDFLDNDYADTDEDALEYDQESESAPVQEEEEPDDGSIPRKVRPKRKNGYGLFAIPHLISTGIWAALILLIGISLGRLLWLGAADVLAFGRQDKTVTITITTADTLDTITNKLHNAGLIKYPNLFKMYAKLAKVEEKGKISAGTFELNTLYDYHALVGGMSATSSYRETVEVMIPEGYTCAQIFAMLEENGVCTVAELENYAATSEFSSYWFLEGAPRGHKYCLEGFMYPDTYEFYTNDTPQRIFHKFLSRFDDMFSDEMVAQIDELNERLAQMYRSRGLSQTYIDENKLTIYEVVTIASMIEKETAHTGEIRTISSVIYNRLTNPGNYPYLNIDATLVYALGGKTDLTAEDKKFDNPYNTYLYKGLPPGPISNPGMFSLKAALDPLDTGYYFYALDPSIHEHKFFKTYDEHKNFLASLGD